VALEAASESIHELDARALRMMRSTDATAPCALDGQPVNTRDLLGRQALSGGLRSHGMDEDACVGAADGIYTPSAVSYAPSVAKRRGFAEPPRCITPAGVVGRDGDRRGAPVASRCCISRRRDGHLARMR
jgi:hypothetical protein